MAVASSRPLQPGPLYPPPKKIHGAAQGYPEPSGAKHTPKHDLKRPWSLSGQIRPRPAGETITGWLDHSTAGAGGLEEATAGGGPSNRGRRVGLPRELEGAADGGLAFPTDGGVISRERRGPVSRGRRRKLRKWRVGFPRQRRPAGMSQRQSGELESAAIRRA